MPRNTDDGRDPASPLEQLPHMARESAEQIWLAGLGAFSKAQQEGSKVFNALVQDGKALQKQAQDLAQEQLQEAGSRMSSLASSLSSRASEPLDKLEGLFDQRVARTLERLQVPRKEELQQLKSQIDSLESELKRLRESLDKNSTS
ncbi:phasin family protein [Diaphorobacter sp.]|uniref:phasin family protein n=1 Tax=Diaphorobacter sp. TaxID=1934310 RepID=UPI0028ABCDE4|nr:phasin family protein [Diaphorobacter sp.]